MKIEFSDLNEEERKQFENEVDGDSAGCGIIRTGKYHVLAYRPIKMGGKCVGLTTIISKMDNEEGSTLVSREEVLYKLPWYCKQKSFKERLDVVVKDQVGLVSKLDKDIDNENERVIKEIADREKAVKEYTKKVRSCRLKIDSTIKTIVPEAKSMIEYNSERLLAEKAAEEATPVADININPEDFINAPSYVNHEEGHAPSGYTSEREKQEGVNNTILNTTPYKYKQKNGGFYTLPPRGLKVKKPCGQIRWSNPDSSRIL